VTPEYPFAVAIVAGVSLVVALVATILTWRRETLLARIAALRAGLQPQPRSKSAPRIPWVERRHAAILGHHITGRAPPLSIAA
jgi:hypothetical protein